MERAERLYTLDGLRGIAAILVLLFHMNAVFKGPASGYLAVDFFFGLSGLVLARTYRDRFLAGLRVDTFFGLRLIRFYPLFAVGMGIGLVRAAGQILSHQPNALSWTETIASFLLGLFMLPMPTSWSSLYPLNPPAWTLFFELIANAIFAVALVRLPVKSLIAVNAACAVGLWLTASNAEGLWEGSNWGEGAAGLFRVIFSFAAGMVVEMRNRKSAARRSLFCLLPAAIVVTALLFGPPDRGRWLYDFICIVAVFPAVLVLGCRWNPPRLFDGVASMLGEMSFALYVIHYPLVSLAIFAARRAGWPVPLWLPLFVALMVALAWLLARYVDEPARRRLIRLAASMKRALNSSAST
jgi:peptidoglycan/LPS O-acetylase OafA/YrhL